MIIKGKASICYTITDEEASQLYFSPSGRSFGRTICPFGWPGRRSV